METENKTALTVQTTVKAPVEKVWKCWTEPAHITQWCQASDDWHAPAAESDLRPGGSFSTTMAARDGSMSFDFNGVYTAVEPHRTLAYTIADGRKVQITFTGRDGETDIVETFEAEDTFPQQVQQEGWQAILDNFKKYVEAKS